jgi:peptide-methionine (R)-S-oxide reductase
MARRRTFIAMLGAALGSCALSRTFAQSSFAHVVEDTFPPLRNPNTPWQEILEPERFEILFQEETEFAGSSSLNAEKRHGTYVCAACHLPLFRSEHKYDSGTGWPSFTQPIEKHIASRTDHRGREPIIEYHCARCGGHQGHVFDDGPPPRGERWCNNGLAVLFVAQTESLPKLRG